MIYGGVHLDKLSGQEAVATGNNGVGILCASLLKTFNSSKNG
jgi:hypothetical protein